jgi:thiosulfate/3-mercaptopyruvate sulfurtransferase
LYTETVKYATYNSETGEQSMTDSLLVGAEWLREHLDDPSILIVDTRGASDFEEGHISGATNLPSGELFDPEGTGSQMLPTNELVERLGAAGIDDEQHLILYDASGLVPSAKVFWVLEHLGRSRVALLDGGFPGWVTKRFPTAQGHAPPTPTTFRPAVAPEESPGAAANVADKDDVLAAIGRDDTLIIDTRTPDEYHGRTDAHVRNGHIPGAFNVDWQQHIVDLFDPTLVSREKLANLYDQIGATGDKTIITYCRTASRSSHTYFVLRLLGFERVRNYSGSWMEWSTDPDLPIE